jgi:hypothetical protein
MSLTPRSEQQSAPHSVVWRVAIIAAVVIFLTVSYLFVTAPEDEILRVVPDDAFYYLQIARNIAHLGRSTADGLSNTNGYHPLWMLLVTGLAWLIPDAALLMRSAITVSLVIHLCAAVAMHYSLRGIVGERWALTAAVCWLVNPLAFVIAQQTVEASVYAVSMLAVFTMYGVVTRQSGGGISRTAAAGFGVILGMMCLARTEGVVVAGLALTSVFIRAAAGRGFSEGVRSLASASAGFVAIVLPWLVFSIRQVGTIVQDSGAMKALWAADVHNGWSDRLRGVRYLGEYFVRRSVSTITGFDASTALLVALCLAAGCAIIFTNVRDRGGQGAQAQRAVLVAALAIWFADGLLLSEQQIWWLAFPCVAMILLLFLTLPGLFSTLDAGRTVQTWVQAALMIASIAAFGRSFYGSPPLYPWQPDVRSSQRTIETLVAVPERIGCFNAGIPMFFGGGRVVALDGLVSHRARTYWADRRFDEFLRFSEIHYIADEQRALNRSLRFVRIRPELETLTAYPLTGWPTGERILWRLHWPETARQQ